MTAPEVADVVERGGVILDLRPPRAFAAGHLPGAVNLQFNRADLAERAEMVLPKDPEYVVHAEPDPIGMVAVKILLQAGFKVAGHLAGGLRAWKSAGQPVEQMQVIEVDELRAALDLYKVVDSRETYEYRHGHIAGAVLLPSDEAWSRAKEFSDGRPLAVVCGDQVRSSLVASLFLRSGKEAVLVTGGRGAWLGRGYPVEKGVPVQA